MTDEELPTHYKDGSNIILLQDSEFQPKREQIIEECNGIHDKEEEAQNTQASNYYQDFCLYNMRELALRIGKDFKPMSEYQFGKFLTNYVNYFSESIESSEKVMSAIDF